MDYYSMQLFSPTYDNFNPAASFEYWTAMAVTDFEMIPDGMDSFTITVAFMLFFLITERCEQLSVEYILLLVYRVPSMF
jgi:AraC family transcriptional regulator